MSEVSPPVHFNEIHCRSGRVGVATLSHPKALNSLTLPMVQSLARQLQKWESEPDIALVILHSESERAFCAGGDVKSIAQKILASRDHDHAAEFFRWEYRTDYMIQTYSKPIVAWGDGIVMGGGIGLFNGASHRVVTERTLMAMPEINIGFFPDVGGGYFLNRLPDGIGLFLGWTGARLSAADALHLEMADFHIRSDKKTEFLDRTREFEWSRITENNHAHLAGLLFDLRSEAGPARIASHESAIREKLAGRSAVECYRSLKDWNPGDAWLKGSLEALFKGSPTSAHVIYEQLRRAKGLALLDVFAMEWTMAVHMSKGHDFPEGVRSLLIDKDGRPNWVPASFDAVSPGHVSSYFEEMPGTQSMRDFLMSPVPMK